MFRMLGSKVELIRYIVVYTENDIEIAERCISDEHKYEVETMLEAKGIQFTTEIIDQTNNEWFNGLEFNSYDEALIVFNGGKLPINQEQINAILISKVNELTLLLKEATQ